jgi:hypothetical protein
MGATPFIVVQITFPVLIQQVDRRALLGPTFDG